MARTRCGGQWPAALPAHVGVRKGLRKHCVMDPILRIAPSVGGRLGCFCLLAVTDSAAADMPPGVPDLSFPGTGTPGHGTAGHSLDLAF